MKFTKDWLNDHLNTKKSEKQIIEKQSNSSLLWLTTPLIIGLLFYISLRIREARS